MAGRHQTVFVSSENLSFGLGRHAWLVEFLPAVYHP
jgi:hypothetical protein